MRRPVVTAALALSLMIVARQMNMADFAQMVFDNLDEMLEHTPTSP